MTQAEQILNQVKDRVTKELGFSNFLNMYELCDYYINANIIDQIALEFAREMCELQREEIAMALPLSFKTTAHKAPNVYEK